MPRSTSSSSDETEVAASLEFAENLIQLVAEEMHIESLVKMIADESTETVSHNDFDGAGVPSIDDYDPLLDTMGSPGTLASHSGS